MKKFFSKQKTINVIAIFVGISFIIVSLYSKIQEKVQAQTPTGGVGFSGVTTTIFFCCNGVMFTLIPYPTSVSKAVFYIHTWLKQVPQPFIGLGMYQWWILKPGIRNLGSSMPGGVCQNPATKCTPLVTPTPLMDVWREGVTAV